MTGKQHCKTRVKVARTALDEDPFDDAAWTARRQRMRSERR